MKFYRAFYDSRSFSFEAYGKTRDEAHKLMVKGLRKHTKNYDLPNNDWWYEDSIGVYEVELGKAYCDYSELDI
jgi:hypothetical protein